MEYQPTTVESLKRTRADLVRQAQTLVDRAEAERRDMTEAEASTFDRLTFSAGELDGEIGAIMQTLRRRHDAYLDTQLLSGSGTAPQHRGIRAVSGVNTTSYTAATPTGAGLLPKIYEAISEVADARAGEVYPTAIVMHSRRANWLASTLSSTFPLFSQSMLVNQPGTQDNGFVSSFAGLQVIIDNNVGTTYGTGTNEDEIYVVALEDLYLLESPLFVRVWDDVGSGNGLIRFQVFSHSAFLSKRYPASISVLSGTGLAAPTWA